MKHSKNQVTGGGEMSPVSRDKNSSRTMGSASKDPNQNNYNISRGLENAGPGFADLGIAPKLMQILEQHAFKTPTPIQSQSIPTAILGKDIIGIAQTGTGKTLAFAIPMIQRLAQSQGKHIGLVVLPTRELALQVNETFQKIGKSIGLRTAILIGGESMPRQLKMIQQKPHLIIATPGRLIDHLQSGKLKLDRVNILVLDEADRMLDMGFAPQINSILKNVPKQRQTMLFSATMPDQIVAIARSHMLLPVRIEVAPSGTPVDLVTQELFFVPREGKTALLQKILGEYRGSVLIFCRTKHGAKKIARVIRSLGHSSAEIHSNRSLKQRLEALEGFKIGKYRVLVATDIAARGIDVQGISLVLNYDLPGTAEDYVHRIGRSGRAGLAGHAISFATPDQTREIKSIERLIRKALTVSKVGTMPNAGTMIAQVRAMPRDRAISHGRAIPQSSRGYFMPRRPGSPRWRSGNRSGNSGHRKISAT